MLRATLILTPFSQGNFRGLALGCIYAGTSLKENLSKFTMSQGFHAFRWIGVRLVAVEFREWTDFEGLRGLEGSSAFGAGITS